MSDGLQDELTVVHSAGWGEGPYALSVVVPFYQYDATPLLLDLMAKIAVNAEPAELVFLDDGSPDQGFFDRLAAIIRTSSAPIRAIRSHRNLGRSGARNCLVAFARAPFLLFLDSDMLPDSPDYLERYVDEIRGGTVFAYGGRSVARCGAIAPEHRLHWYFTRRFEQVPAAVRATEPAIFFLSSNFLIRGDIIKAIPLDARFKGWGWEDCEWAFRVCETHALKHIDNSASHLGLIDLATIKKKYRESVANFSLILDTCPQLVQRTPLYKIAARMAGWRIGRATERLAGGLAGATWLPLSLRARLLQIYKAALYSSVVR